MVKMVKIAVHSDLHLEFEKIIPDISQADIVILAGDISPSLKDLNNLYLELQLQKEIPILYIPGNHDYYHSAMAEVNKNLKIMDDDNKNFYMMNNRKLTFLDIDFFGSTLWSDFTLDQDLSENFNYARFNAKRMIADFRVISYKNRRFSTEDCIDLYNTSKNALIKFLAKPSQNKKVVFTHFAINSLCSHQIHRGSDLNPYFTANVNKQIKQYQPHLWIYGHTHFNNNFNIGDTRVISNQRGYPGELDDYVQNYLFEINSKKS